MFLTHCTMGWIVLAVICVNVPVLSSMKVTQPYRVVSTSGTAQFLCLIHPQTSHTQTHPNQLLVDPLSRVEDVRVILLRGLHGSQKICASILNISEQQKKKQQDNNGDVECAVQFKDGAVEVALSGLKATHTDIYRCQIQIFYPPPYLEITGNGTLLHVLESSNCPAMDPQRQEGEVEEEEVEMKTPVSVSVMILGITILCVLVLIITLQTLQCKRGRREPVRVLPNVLVHKVDAVPF